MLLALDVGNSNTVLGLYTLDGTATLVANWRVTTARTQTADEYGVLFVNLFRMHGIAVEQVGHIIISSVVPPLDGTLKRACEVYFHCTPAFIDPARETILPIHTELPSELGADRLVNAAAAVDKYGCPAIVVDFGTATTFDLISARGEFKGGVIAPGLGISADALFTRAARLARVEIRRPESVIGTTTATNIQSGLYYGYIGLVDGILERMLGELAATGAGEPTVVATGGLAGLISADSRYIRTTDDLLTLEGLRLVFEHNRRRERAGSLAHEPAAAARPLPT